MVEYSHFMEKYDEDDIEQVILSILPESQKQIVMMLPRVRAPSIAMNHPVISGYLKMKIPCAISLLVGQPWLVNSSARAMVQYESRTRNHASSFMLEPIMMDIGHGATCMSKYRKISSPYLNIFILDAKLYLYLISPLIIISMHLMPNAPAVLV